MEIENIKHGPVISPLGIDPRDWKVCSLKNLYINIPSSIIYNGYTVKTTQMFIVWWIDKYNIMYPHGGIIFCTEKKQSTGTWSKIDETSKYFISERSQ